MIALGNFEGGQLVVEEQGKSRIVNAKNTWISFKGNHFHEETDFTGTRYSLVYFTIGNYKDLSTQTANALKELGFPFLDGTTLEQYIKTSKEENEDRKKTSKEAIKSDLDRLAKALPELVNSWPSPAVEEIQLISGCYDILNSMKHKDIARIQTAQKSWYGKTGLTVAALNPA